MLRLEMLPATNGDCLWIEYGDPEDPHRILIDGGTGTKASLAVLDERVKDPRNRHFDLVVVTHVDADHIAGILKFLNTKGLGLTIDQIWFNAYQHLIQAVTLGGPQGELLSDYITALETQGLIKWNADFGGNAVKVPDAGQLQVVQMPEGLTLTILAPGKQELALLEPKWREECEKAGIVPGAVRADLVVPEGIATLGAEPDVQTLAATTFKEDSTLANGSSIVLLLEYDRRRILLAGDAHPSVMDAGITRLVGPNAKLKVDAYKVAHHGSRHNTSIPFLRRLDCSQYLFSTNGSRFEHPSQESIARIVANRQNEKTETELVFNYATDFNLMWQSGNESFRKTWNYRATYPTTNKRGIVVDFPPLVVPA